MIITMTTFKRIAFITAIVLSVLLILFNIKINISMHQEQLQQVKTTIQNINQNHNINLNLQYSYSLEKRIAYKFVKFKYPDETNEIMYKLDTFQIMFSKIVIIDDYICVWYPKLVSSIMTNTLYITNTSTNTTIIGKTNRHIWGMIF